MGIELVASLPTEAVGPKRSRVLRAPDPHRCVHLLSPSDASADIGLEVLARRYCSVVGCRLVVGDLGNCLTQCSEDGLDFVVVWGVAPRWPIARVLEVQAELAKQRNGRLRLAFHVGRDLRQLLWLCFKILVYQTVPDRTGWPTMIPSAMAPGHVPQEGSEVVVVNQAASVAAAAEAWRRPCDLLVQYGHGRSYEANLQQGEAGRLSLCGRERPHLPRPGELGPRCTRFDECFRDATPGHHRLPVGELRARALLLGGCESFRLGEADGAPATSLAVAALDGWATAVVASPYLTPATPGPYAAAVEARRRGATMGDVLDVLNDKGPPIFFLVGNPLQRQSSPVSHPRINSISGGGEEIYSVIGLRVPFLSMPAPTPEVLRGDNNAVARRCGEWGGWSLYRLDDSTSPTLSLRPIEPMRPPDALDGKRMARIGCLLGVEEDEGHGPTRTRTATLLNLAERHRTTTSGAPLLPLRSDRLARKAWSRRDASQRCATCDLPIVEWSLRLWPLRSRGDTRPPPWAIDTVERQCPRCTIVFHGRGDLGFTVAPVVQPDEPLLLTSLHSSAIGTVIRWAQVVRLEPSPLYTWLVPTPPASTTTVATTELLLPAGLPREGAHYVRVYELEIDDLELRMASHQVIAHSAASKWARLSAHPPP